MDSEDDFYAYIIIDARGCGNDRQGRYLSEAELQNEESPWVLDDDGLYFLWDYENQHRSVWGTIPIIVREALVHTEELDPEDGPDECNNKWCGALNKQQWEAFRDAWFIEPDRCDDTMGMITEYGHMWALADMSSGDDWNMGGIYPVDFVSTYFCTQEQEFIDRLERNV